MASELVALVKHDCPVCDQVLPALDAAGVRVVSQSDPAQTAAQAARLGLSRVPEVDADLALSERLDPEAVPAVVLLDGGREEGRVEGLDRARIVELAVHLLEGTARHPQDLVGVLPPYDGEATVEKVAINAVMAGCAPEHLPVVLAAVEAACRPEFALHGLVATTHPAGPVIVAFGTGAGINAAGNVLGQGARANLAIGRALQLVVRNVGGGRPGIED